MSDQTLFEKILCGDIPGNFIARGENWASFLDVFPRSQGHTLVVPKRAAKRITELEKEEPVSYTHLTLPTKRSV